MQNQMPKPSRRGFFFGAAAASAAAATVVALPGLREQAAVAAAPRPAP